MKRLQAYEVTGNSRQVLRLCLEWKVFSKKRYLNRNLNSTKVMQRSEAREVQAKRLDIHKL
jgi:hypothetical protein